jgi:hypothetical protein
VDLSLHKLATNRRKRLMQGTLFENSKLPGDLVTDVNKPGELRDGLL